MAAEDYKRRLRAILSADVEGYSRLMGEDEDNTVRTLTAYREIISSLIEKHHGRVVGSPGDNVLAEFESVRDAVQSAVEIQKELRTKNSELIENRQMRFRIGINLGDVITEGTRIYGDGVNVAARIESLSDPGGICLSRSAYDQVIGKIDVEYNYLGEHEVKNIERPVRVYKVLMDSIPDDSSHNERSNEPPSVKTDMSLLSEKPSIAVLPFLNMSNDPDQEYFSDGISEEIISALARLEDLKVISRTSAFFFKGKDTDIRTIGEKLKVNHILEGSVRKAGNKIRITAQLIKVSDDTHLWADTYDRELEDVFAIQDEISRAVVENLKVKILNLNNKPLVKDYTKSIEAYELFLKGRFIWINFQDSEKSFDYFERAIKADPQFAPAYSYLAMSYYHYSLLFPLSSNETWLKVKTLAEKALEIDEMDAYTQASIGRIKSFYEFDWQGGESHYKRAIELNPSLSDVYYEYALYLIGVGRVYQAIEEMKRGFELDPFSTQAASLVGIAYYFAHEFDQALAQMQKVRALSDSGPLAYVVIAGTYAVKGMYDKGISIFQPVKDMPVSQMFLGYMYGKAGKKKEAQKILDEFLEGSEKGYFPPYYVAYVYAGLGDTDKSFEWLGKSIQEHDATNWCIKMDPFLDDLHSDPRWAELMERMNLAD